jgi:Mu transposase-like protein
VHRDYHVQVGRAYYSVPYRLIGKQLDVRVSAHMVELFEAGQLVATHPRTQERVRRSTRDAHRPQRHVAIIENNLAYVLKRTAAIGPATLEVLQQQAALRKHPEETLRSAQGILRLASDYSAESLERACERAVALGSYSYRAVRTLIETPKPPPVQPAPDLAHENVRGPEYFQ